MIIDCKKHERQIMNTAKDIIDGIPITSTPTLGIVSCGASDASKVYIRNKIKKCKEVGINVVHYMENDFYDCKNTIRELNESDNIKAIMLQLPTKLTSCEERLLLNSIDSRKDVDGLSNWSKFYQMVDGTNLPCTSMAVLRLINRQYGTDLSGKTVALYGRSDLVNKPLIHVLMKMNATVTVYHSKSPIGDTLGDHDISVVAIGKPRHFKINDTGKEQLIIDVGINRDEDGKLCGDVDTRGFEDSPNILYTPVPNGVGILTTSMLCLKIARMTEEYGEF